MIYKVFTVGLIFLSKVFSTFSVHNLQGVSRGTRAGLLLSAISLSVSPLESLAVVQSESSIQQQDDYSGETIMLEKETFSPLGSPGNSFAENLIGLVFKGLGTYRGEGMDDLKVGDTGEGVFYSVPQRK